MHLRFELGRGLNKSDINFIEIIRLIIAIQNLMRVFMNQFIAKSVEHLAQREIIYPVDIVSSVVQHGRPLVLRGATCTLNNLTGAFRGCS